MGAPKTTKEEREIFCELIMEEIQAHKEGKIDSLTDNKELADFMGVSERSIRDYILIFPKEIRQYRQKVVVGGKSRRNWQDSEYREIITQSVLNQWQDPEFREIRLQQLKNPEFREMIRKCVRKKWKDPEFREMQVEKMRKQASEMWQDFEFRDKQLKRIKSSESRERMRKISKGLWQDSEYREMQIEKSRKLFLEQWQNKGYRERMSRINVGRNHSQESIKKMRLKKLEEIKRKKGQIAPNYNPHACKIINIYGEEYGFNFQHAENGGEFFIKGLGYFLDGYDLEKNVAIEFYESHHERQVEKDKQRQKEIEQHLNCKFIILKEGSREVKDLEAKIEVLAA